MHVCVCERERERERESKKTPFVIPCLSHTLFIVLYLRGGMPVCQRWLIAGGPSWLPPRTLILIKLSKETEVWVSEVVGTRIDRLETPIQL